MIQFETETCWDHSIYGMLFLYHYSPFPDLAEAVMFHHSRWAALTAAGVDRTIARAANLIHFCDRLDIFLTYRQGTIAQFLEQLRRPEYYGGYDPELLALAERAPAEAGSSGARPISCSTGNGWPLFNRVRLKRC